MSELLTIAEVAERLDLSVKAVTRRIERDAIQSVKVEGRRMVPGVEVDRVAKIERRRKAQETSAPTSVGKATTRGTDGAAAAIAALERAHQENRELAVQVARMQLLTEQAESTEQRLTAEIHRLRAELEQAERAQEVHVVDARPSRRRWFARQ